MPDRRVRVTKPGNADRNIRKSELADHIAAGWVPKWDQSVETLATQVGVLRDAVVELAGDIDDAAPPPVDGEGAPGTDGRSAYQVAVDNGFQGTVQQWLASLVGPQGAPGPPGAASTVPGPPGSASTVPGPPGTPGKDAYEIARDLGYGGTRTQWLATLVGPQGVKGDKGDQGIQGVAGTNGSDGAPGAPGVGFASLAKTAADQQFTTVTLGNITGLSATLTANTPYRLEALLSVTSAALTTGWQLGFTGPAMSSFLAVCDYQSTAIAWTTATLTAIGAFPLVTAAYAITPTPIAVRISGLLLPSAAGTLQLQCRTEVAASAITVKRGSTLHLI